MNIRFPWNAGTFLATWERVRFSGRTLLHWVSYLLAYLVSYLVIQKSVSTFKKNRSFSNIQVLWDMTPCHNDATSQETEIFSDIRCMNLNYHTVHHLCKQVSVWHLRKQLLFILRTKRKHENMLCRRCAVLLYVEASGKCIYKNFPKYSFSNCGTRTTAGPPTTFLLLRGVNKKSKYGKRLILKVNKT